jgi:hypothetical protein
MKPVTMFVMAAVGVALVATVGLPMAARAQQGPDKAATAQSTPKGWNYDIVNGKRVPRANRQVSADGSSREEVKIGNCVTVKEKSPDGTYKESRSCN